jgi:hypothetical protein
MTRRATVVIVIIVAAIAMGLGLRAIVPGRTHSGIQSLVVGPVEARASDVSLGASSGQQAIDRVAETGEYLFVYFYDGKLPETLSKKGELDAVVSALEQQATSVAVDISDPAEVSFARRLRVVGAPMPMVLAFAPTGAVTASFAGEFAAEQLRSAFVGPAMQTSLAHLQRNHLVLICVQNSQTRWSAEAMQGASDFVADARFAGNADIVVLDPSNPAEREFMVTLGVDPKTPDAVTILMVPPGTAVAKLVGKTDKNALVKELEASATRPGCAPSAGSGCCPKK